MSVGFVCMTWFCVKAGAAGAPGPPPPSTVKRPFFDPELGRHCLDVVILLLAPLVDDEGAVIRDPLALAAGWFPGRGAIGRGKMGRNRPDADDDVVD